jgi:hypothetical protein
MYCLLGYLGQTGAVPVAYIGSSPVGDLLRDHCCDF